MQPACSCDTAMSTAVEHCGAVLTVIAAYHSYRVASSDLLHTHLALAGTHCNSHFLLLLLQLQIVSCLQALISRLNG